MTNQKTNVFLASLLLILTLSSFCQAFSQNADRMQGRVLVAEPSGQKKKTDLGPRRSPKKTEGKKSTPKTKAEQRKAGYMERKKMRKNYRAAVNELKNTQEAIQLVQKRMKRIRANIKKMRANYKKQKMRGHKKRDMLSKLIKKLNKFYAGKTLLKKHKLAAHNLKVSIEKQLAEIKKKNKKFHARIKAGTAMGKLKKEAGPNGWAKMYIKHIINRGKEMRAKLFAMHWGKKVALGGDYKTLPLTHRYMACVKKECSNISVWKRHMCRMDCKKRMS